MKKKVIKLMVAVAMLAVTAVGAMFMSACTDKNYKFGKEVVSLGAQIDVLTNMNNGSADIGVMDSVMAGYYMSKSAYKDSMEVVPFYLSEEKYGIGAKKGNDSLTAKINEGLIALAKNGEMANIAATFGLGSEVIVDVDATLPAQEYTDGAWEAVVASKKLVIGYTVFAPIAYEEDGNLTGYDIELAKAVANYLNATYGSSIVCEFNEIEWDSKETLLENKSIDLVWNGMTITPARTEGMSMSIPYLANKQAIIIKKADKEKYDFSSLEAFMKSAEKAIVAVEAGSAAEEIMVIK